MLRESPRIEHDSSSTSVQLLPARLLDILKGISSHNIEVEALATMAKKSVRRHDLDNTELYRELIDFLDSQSAPMPWEEVDGGMWPGAKLSLTVRTRVASIPTLLEMARKAGVVMYEGSVGRRGYRLAVAYRSTSGPKAGRPASSRRPSPPSSALPRSHTPTEPRVTCEQKRVVTSLREADSNQWARPRHFGAHLATSSAEGSAVDHGRLASRELVGTFGRVRSTRTSRMRGSRGKRRCPQSLYMHVRGRLAHPKRTPISVSSEQLQRDLPSHKIASIIIDNRLKDWSALLDECLRGGLLVRHDNSAFCATYTLAPGAKPMNSAHRRRVFELASTFGTLLVAATARATDNDWCELEWMFEQVEDKLHEAKRRARVDTWTTYVEAARQAEMVECAGLATREGGRLRLTANGHLALALLE